MHLSGVCGLPLLYYILLCLPSLHLVTIWEDAKSLGQVIVVAINWYTYFTKLYLLYGEEVTLNDNKV